MNSGTKRTIQRITMVMLIVGLLVLLIYLVGYHKKNQRGYDNQYYDKYSGQTISDINGKSPEKDGSSNSGPLFLGFQTLIDYGYTQDQVSSLQAAINQYISRDKLHVEHVSFDATDFKKNDAAVNDPTTNEISFNVVFDFKDKYLAKLQSDTISSISLQLANPAGKEIFTYTDGQNPDETGPNTGY